MTIPAGLAVVSDQPSSDQSQGPFEGPEKLLEVWFAPSIDSLPSPSSHASSSSSTLPLRESFSNSIERGGEYRGLRKVPRKVWEEMLDIVKCKVLSVVEGDELDAYLLRWASCLQLALCEELMSRWY
jgi:S-adenosylmethionine decarboxylase